MTTAAEQACYTLINIPQDAEPPNEMQLRQDLGNLVNYNIALMCKLEPLKSCTRIPNISSCL